MEMMITKTMDLLIENNPAVEEKRKIYEYGLNVLYSSLANILGIITIFSLFGYFKEIIMVILFFAYLRTFAGGFHAKRRLTCFLLFNILSGLVIYGASTIEMSHYLKELSFGLLQCILFVSIFAPLDTNSKLLKDNQKQLYRKKSIVIVLSQSLLIFGLYKMSYDGVALIGILSIYAVVFTMVLRILQKLLRGESIHEFKII